MQRVCFHLRVRADRMAEYRDRHRRSGRRCCRHCARRVEECLVVPVAEDGLLTGYLECDDFEQVRTAMAQRPVNEWQSEMAGFFEHEGQADEQMRAVPLIFHLD